MPKFDPDKFKPGYTPQIVKKGNEEYAIVVSGVQDTGLCGKYWGSLDPIKPRKRNATQTYEASWSALEGSHESKTVMQKGMYSLTPLNFRRRRSGINTRQESNYVDNGAVEEVASAFPSSQAQEGEPVAPGLISPQLSLGRKELEEESLYCFCRQESSDDMLGCDFCPEWYHPKCLKISDTKVRELVQQENWKCPKCSCEKSPRGEKNLE